MGINAITIGIWAAAGGTGSVPTNFYADPYWDNVAILLHGDVLTDSSKYARTVVTNNSVDVSSVSAKFGTGALSFNAASDYLQYATATELKMTSGDITIEFWINPSNLASNAGVLSNGEAIAVSLPNYRVELQSTGKIRFLFGASYNYYGSIIGDMLTTTAISTSTYSHVAICKKGTTYLIFINGVLDVSAVYTTDPYDTTTSAFFRIGANGVLPSFIGYIDDLRITNGVARYTANFNPPTASFYAATMDDSYRYIRIYITANNGDAYTSIQEIELHTTYGGSDVTSTSSATGQSDYYNTNTFARTLDGGMEYSLECYVSATGVGFPHWGYVDLGEKSVIRELKMWSQNYAGGAARAPKDFKVQGSNDLSTWIDLSVQTNITNWVAGTPKVFQF